VISGLLLVLPLFILSIDFKHLFN